MTDLGLDVFIQKNKYTNHIKRICKKKNRFFFVV